MSMRIEIDGPRVVLEGDFDVRSTGQVREAVYRTLAEQDADVVVDLTEVTSVDLTALRVLAVATREAARGDRHLRLRGCCPNVRRLLHVSRLIRVLEVERVPA
ncbi:MAG TPA: STAS domain-containing protein [Nocardioides sp.]|uniref:STAS domain-containing protein n=1 Tax=Nocardioides sp. TaxID=35761 RepID=UPI002C535B1F|nr:STAS domain-containing protein [Nocardioides sp.]HQR25825.1 STAS domain-containing protein [Nocardioides sp.]